MNEGDFVAKEKVPNFRDLVVFFGLINQ